MKNKKRYILVGGNDDKVVVKKILQKCGIRNVSVKKLGDWKKLVQGFMSYLKGSDVECVGVVIDADRNLESRWQAIRGKLIGVSLESIKLISLTVAEQ